MCQLVLPAMRAQRAGRIVNVSSMGGNFTFPGGGFYHATKYAVEAISDALRFEVKGFGVRVVDHRSPGSSGPNFGEAAATAVGDAEAEGPYGGFNATVAKATQDVYDQGRRAPPRRPARGGGQGDRARDHLEVARRPATA